MTAPYIQYFGEMPTTILMTTSDAFDGTAQLADPIISPGLYSFQAQSGGGLYMFHVEPIKIKSIISSVSGAIVINKVLSTGDVVQVETLPGSGELAQEIILTPSEHLTFTSSDPGTISVTASLVGYSRFM